MFEVSFNTSRPRNYAIDKIIMNLRLLFSQDIEECQTNTDNCHVDANCTNTKGSFFCTCHTGYSGDGVMCVGEELQKYSPDACSWSDMSYLSAFLTECRRWIFSQVKKVDLWKVELRGSYTNRITDLILFFVCFLDINECAPDTLSVNHTYYANDCHDDSNCTNTKGSFYCTCLNGYSGNGVNCVGKPLYTSLFEG